jgi:hypothetical protein
MNSLLLLILVSIYCRAEIIDRVAVVLGNEVITESEILREIRLTAFLNGSALDFSAAAKRKTAGRLVEQHLIAAEAKANSRASLDPEELEQTLQQVRERFPSPANYKAELERTGVTEDELKAHLARQIITLSFLDFRFRPGIQISDDEITKYFNERVAPGLKKTPTSQQFSVDDYRPEMEEALIGERVDKAADAWLMQARARTHIEYRKDVFGDETPKQQVSK